MVEVSGMQRLAPSRDSKEVGVVPGEREMCLERERCFLSSLGVWRWAGGDLGEMSLEGRKLTQWLRCFICMNFFLGSLLYESAQAAREKCLSDLNNKNLFLTLLDAGKSMGRLPASLALAESSLPSWPSSHDVVMRLLLSGCGDLSPLPHPIRPLFPSWGLHLHDLF